WCAPSWWRGVRWSPGRCRFYPNRWPATGGNTAPRGAGLRSVDLGQSVLPEQRVEALETGQIVGAEVVAEPAEIGLHFLPCPARLGLPARHLGERGETGGERGLEELRELELHGLVQAPSHRPHGVDEREPGPLEPVRAEVERVREAFGTMVPHAHRLIADHEERRRLGGLEAAHVAHSLGS